MSANRKKKASTPVDRPAKAKKPAPRASKANSSEAKAIYGKADEVSRHQTLNARGIGALPEYSPEPEAINSLDSQADFSVWIDQKDQGYMEDIDQDIQQNSPPEAKQDLTARGTLRKYKKPRPRGTFDETHPRTEKDRNDALLNVRVDKDLRERFRACVENTKGLTQKDAITEAIEYILAKYENE